MAMNHPATGTVALRRAAMAAILLVSAARAETIFLECERFKDLGGWTVESQFSADPGSSYLIAHGLGRPVAAATTTFSRGSTVFFVTDRPRRPIPTTPTRIFAPISLPPFFVPL